MSISHLNFKGGVSSIVSTFNLPRSSTLWRGLSHSVKWNPSLSNSTSLTWTPFPWSEKGIKVEEGGRDQPWSLSLQKRPLNPHLFLLPKKNEHPWQWNGVYCHISVWVNPQRRGEPSSIFFATSYFFLLLLLRPLTHLVLYYPTFEISILCWTCCFFSYWKCDIAPRAKNKWELEKKNAQFSQKCVHECLQQHYS